MSSKLYKHKQTGKLYSLEQENIEIKHKIIEITEEELEHCWEDGFVLYKAGYENPEGPYYVRYGKDFYDNFEEVKDETD